MTLNNFDRPIPLDSSPISETVVFAKTHNKSTQIKLYSKIIKQQPAWQAMQYLKNGKSDFNNLI